MESLVKKERRLAKSDDRECIQLAGRKNSANQQSLQIFFNIFVREDEARERTTKKFNFLGSLGIVGVLIIH